MVLGHNRQLIEVLRQVRVRVGGWEASAGGAGGKAEGRRV